MKKETTTLNLVILVHVITAVLKITIGAINKSADCLNFILQMSRLPGTAEGTKWKLVGSGANQDEEIYQEIEENEEEEIERLKKLAKGEQVEAPKSQKRIEELTKLKWQEGGGKEEYEARTKDQEKHIEDIRRRGFIADWMKTLCFSHELALDPFAWEYPEGEFERMGIDRSDLMLFEEIKRRSDWFKANKPELLPHNPWRWSGHPGRQFKLYNGPEELREKIILEMKETVEKILVRKNYTRDGRFAGTTKREPKHTWTKQHGKQNEQTLHAAIEPAFRRADCIISLVTVIPVTPWIVPEHDRSDITHTHNLYPPPKQEPNPEFGSLAEEWLKVPAYLARIKEATENLPGCIRVGVVVEAHPSHGYGKKKKGAAKPAPGELGGREERYADEVLADAVQGNDATSFPRARPPRGAQQKRMAAARKKAKQDAKKDVMGDPRFSDKDPDAFKNLTDEVIRLRAELYQKQQQQEKEQAIPPQPAPPPKKAPAAAPAAPQNITTFDNTA